MTFILTGCYVVDEEGFETQLVSSLKNQDSLYNLVLEVGKTNLYGPHLEGEYCLVDVRDESSVVISNGGEWIELENKELSRKLYAFFSDERIIEICFLVDGSVVFTYAFRNEELKNYILTYKPADKESATTIHPGWHLKTSE